MAEQLNVLISAEALVGRIAELAREIEGDFAATEKAQAKADERKPLVVIGVLNGAFMFMADLVRQLKLPLQVDFLRASSYGNVTETSGVVQIRKDLEIEVTGRDVLLVEDIVDTGMTLAYLVKHLNMQKPTSVKVCCLLDKKERRRVPFEADYVGFSIPDQFVVGYGLDYAERFRELPSICIIEGLASE